MAAPVPPVPLTELQNILLGRGALPRDDNQTITMPPGTIGGCTDARGAILPADINAAGIHTGCGFHTIRHPVAAAIHNAGPLDAALNEIPLSPWEVLRLNINNDFDLLKASPMGADVALMGRIRAEFTRLQHLASSPECELITQHLDSAHGWDDMRALNPLAVHANVPVGDWRRLNDFTYALGECTIKIFKMRTAIRTSSGGPDPSIHVIIINYALVRAEGHALNAFMQEKGSASGLMTGTIIPHVDKTEYTTLHLRQLGTRVAKLPGALWYPCFLHLMKNFVVHLIAIAIGTYQSRPSAQHLLNQLNADNNHTPQVTPAVDGAAQAAAPQAAAAAAGRGGRGAGGGRFHSRGNRFGGRNSRRPWGRH
jgi:hypothetical protein